MPTNDMPVKVYYPVCYVVLQVRLEEFAGDIPREAQQALFGATGTFNWVPGFGRWMEAQEGDSEKVKAALKRTFVVQTAPESVSITHSSYRLPDEATVTLKWSAMPLDPQVVRSISVSIYLGTVPERTFAEKMRDGVAINEVARTDTNARWTVADLLNEENLRFSGFADEVSVHHGDDGDTLTLNCRDWTASLLDTPVPSATYRKPLWDGYIEDVIANVLADFDGTNNVPLHIYGFKPGELKMSRGSHHKAGKSGKAATRSRGVRDENYWDLLTDLSVKNGLVLYADRYRFVLRPATSIYEEPQDEVEYYETIIGKGGWSRLTEQGFASKRRRLPGTDRVAPNAVMVFGANIRSLDITRRLGRVKIPGVRVVTVDGKEPWSYTFPENAKAQAGTMHPSGLWAKEEIRVLPVTGVESKDDLKIIARQAFEEIGRGDQTLTLETDDLASFGGDNSDPDLLDLRAGIPMSVLFAKETQPQDGAPAAITTRLAFEAMSESELRAYMKDRLRLSDEAATALAGVLKRPETRRLLARQWYVREATHDWSNDGGYKLRVEALNYQQVRVDKWIDQEVIEFPEKEF